MADIQPSPTLYIQNLDSKISKEDLRHLLYIYFSTYGKVLDVIALKNNKMRGQAFVVFKDLATSTAAMRKEDGRLFAGKGMKIGYARGKSFATIENESGKEALYQYRIGIVKNPEASRKLTVSGAGKALGSAKSKRDRQEGEEEDIREEDEDEEEEGEDAQGPNVAKKAKINGDLAQEDEDDAMQVASDDEDEAALGPTPA
ncbi:MAG: hypothetical protein CYPHOPRED_001690 [Cyphobasidiales sp. Tagirdzhanova-0007]|nr:MAG: hypothetical protein CYPHOPRED_001690 [Cyphobasidiales sp. Tagirdzhanova-0007]